MTREQFLQGIWQNTDRIREYAPGMDGRNGQCDCIGLIIGAVRLAGGKWTGTHGSNWAARNALKSLRKISDAGELRAGDWVFKAYLPGEKGYALPDTYHRHPDQNDYYHVGVVTGVNPLEITHCTGVTGGISRDTSLGKWQYAGEYMGLTEEAKGRLYRVTGGRLKVRNGPGTSCTVIAHLPDNARVTASPVSGNEDWMQVEYEGIIGFSMAGYLMPCRTNADIFPRLCALLEEAVQLVQQLE